MSTPIEDLLLRWQDERESGRELSAEELAGDRPELVEELRKRMASHIKFEGFLRNALPASKSKTKAGDSGDLPTRALASDGTTHEALPQPGERIAEFEIREALGQGAFGTVYRAWQWGMDREVALKVSRVGTHEPRTLSRLDGHPHIVRIYDQRQLPDAGFHLLYMEFVRGVTLREVIARRESLPGEDRDTATLARVISSCQGEPAPARPSNNAVDPDRNWVRQICQMGAKIAEALEFVHARKICHCDIKPANIVLSTDGSPKVIDFNTSCNLEIDSASFGGTLAYMAPEQLAAFQEPDEKLREERIAALDGRNDIYSLGVVLWEALCGRRPFDEIAPAPDGSVTLASLIRQRQKLSIAQALKKLPESLPQGVRAVVVRCLAADPEERYATAGELAHDLRLACNDEFWALVDPPKDFWRDWLLDWRVALALLLVVGLVPNALLSMLDTIWVTRVLDRSGFADLRDFYWAIMAPAIKAIAYPLGAATGIYFTWPILRALQHATEPPAPEIDKSGAASCLQLGQNVALVSVVSWVAAGLVVGLYIGTQTDSLRVTLNAVGSLVLGGTIAAPFAFFPLTFVCIRLFLPPLVRKTRSLPPVHLEWQLEFYLAVAQFAPLLALGLALAANLEGDEFFYLKITLVILAALGMAVARLCYHAIRADLALLEKLPLPEESQ